MIKLTKLEATVFKAIRNTCKVDAWSDVESIVEVTGMAAASVKGVVGSLVKKDMVMVCEDEINGVKHKSIYYIDKNNYQVFFGEVEEGQPDYHTDEEIEEMVNGKPAKVEETKVVEAAAETVEAAAETVEAEVKVEDTTENNFDPMYLLRTPKAKVKTETKSNENSTDENKEVCSYQKRNGTMTTQPKRRKGTKLSAVRKIVSDTLTAKGIVLTIEDLQNSKSDLRKLEKQIAQEVQDEFFNSDPIIALRRVMTVFEDIFNSVEY